jgi:hypothetical protein
VQQSKWKHRRRRFGGSWITPLKVCPAGCGAAKHGGFPRIEVIAGAGCIGSGSSHGCSNVNRTFWGRVVRLTGDQRPERFSSHKSLGEEAVLAPQTPLGPVKSFGMGKAQITAVWLVPPVFHKCLF